MHTAVLPRPTTTVPPPRAAAAVVGVAAAGVVALHAAVTTRPGRRVDGAVLDRVLEHVGGATATARDVLAATSEATVLLALAVLAGVALVRRRPGSAVGAVVVVLGSSATTALVKAVTGGSLPSGHVTAVAGLTCAAALVVARGWRPLVLAVGSVAVLAQGTATMIAGWHRPSDVVAAVLVAAGWTAVVLALRPGGATILA